MGEESSAGAGQQPDPSAWGQPIDDERKRELDELAARQHVWAEQPEATRGESVFKGVRLTGADVFWLTQRALAGSGMDPGVLAIATQRLRSDEDFLRPVIGLTALHLEGANLGDAQLESANLPEAHLEGTTLSAARLERATLSAAHLERANLRAAHLEGATLSAAHLERATLGRAHLEGATLSAAHLERANLFRAHLERANLFEAHLEGTEIIGAHLERAYLFEAHLEGKTFNSDNADWLWVRAVIADFPVSLPPANLREAFLDSATTLRDATLCAPMASVGPAVADVRWGGVNLATLDWTPFTERDALLGDEGVARAWRPQPYRERAELKQASRQQRAEARVAHAAGQQRYHLRAWAAAVRANRQLATALRSQGMSDEADHFAYRAQICQQHVLDLQRKRGRALFSRFLNLLAGYGYKPERTFVIYLVVIALFAALYLLASDGALTFGLPRTAVLGLQWYEALVLSVSSFHGRGFFQPLQNPGDPVAILAAAEAVLGLIIEISFIATFTQRFFGAK